MKFSIIKTIRVVLLSIAVFASAHAQQESTVGPEIGPETLVFRGMKLEGVLQMLEMRTGRAVIRPQALPTPEFTFDSQVPLSNEEAILAIESLLSLNGIGVTPLGEKFLKVIPIDTIRTEAPELVIGPLNDRYASSKVVSKLFRLQYLDSQAFQQQIQPFLSPRFSTIIPFSNSNAVIVTDTVSNLQRLEYVVSEVDKPSRLNIETSFYTLNYAQASEVSDHIQSLIDAARNSFGGDEQSTNNGNRANKTAPEGQIPTPPIVPGGGGIPMQILFGSNTAISSDDRTNQIIIMTEPSNLQFFDNIIAKLDIKADPSTRIEVISLKHADAVEVASLLTDVVSGRTDGEREDRSTANSNNANGNQRPGPFNNARNASNTTQQNRRANGAATTGSGAEESDSQFSDFMTIIADERSNSLVISGTRSDLEIISSLVEQIDVLLAQVQIEVVLVDVNISDEFSRGIDQLVASYDGRATENNGRISLGSTSSDGGSSGGFNLLGLNLSGTNFRLQDGDVSDLFLSTVFQRAKQDSNVSVISSPTVVTTHNREATIVVGQAVPIISSSQSSLSGSSDISRDSYQFEDIALELKVKPLIGPNNVIQLEIEQTFDEIVDTTEVNGNDQPIIGRREASSFISVRDRELVILGGLQRTAATDSSSKTAILGNIPVLGGMFFGSKTKDKTKSELVVFVRPTIMRTTDDVNERSIEVIEKMSDTSELGDFIGTKAEEALKSIQGTDQESEQVEESTSKKKNRRGKKSKSNQP